MKVEFLIFSHILLNSWWLRSCTVYPNQLQWRTLAVLQSSGKSGEGKLEMDPLPGRTQQSTITAEPVTQSPSLAESFRATQLPVFPNVCSSTAIVCVSWRRLPSTHSALWNLLAIVFLPLTSFGGRVCRLRPSRQSQSSLSALGQECGSCGGVKKSGLHRRLYLNA